MEDWLTIKTIKKRNPDMGTRSIAKTLNISRNTVKKALSSERGPEYQREEYVNPEIKPFMDYIYEKLMVKNLRGSRVLNDICSKGYKGSRSAFYRYITKLKPQQERTFQRYETAPGEQAQFDWSPYTVLINNNLTKVYVFNYILGFSRYRVYEGSLSQTQGSTFEALENSFNETGGIPARIQVDNHRNFIDKCSRKTVKWNRRYLAFCGHYGVEVSRSLPKHPWSKGKVENPFDYLETHFISDNSFSCFEGFLNKLKQFQEKVNDKIHETTHQKPQNLFEQEKSSLAALPETRYVDCKEQTRKTTADCLITFEGNRYSVPWVYACREVWVKVSKGCFLTIYSSKNRLIAQHELALSKGKIIMIAEHFKNHQIERGNWQRLNETFLKQFPHHQWFLEKLKAQKRFNSSYHLTQILDIAHFYDDSEMVDAFAACQRYNVFTNTFIKGYLENQSHSPVRSVDLQHISSPENQSIKRPLSEYQKLFKTEVSS